MLNKRYNSGFLTIAFLLIVSTGFTQETIEVRDLEVWSAIELKYKINKKWTLDVEEQLRLKNNASDVDQYFTQFNSKYKASKNFELGGGLRLVRNNDNQGGRQGYENHFRFHLDAGYKHKISAFSLKSRLRYQNKRELGVYSLEGAEVKQTVRFKTSVGYNFKGWKLDPQFSAEIFNRIADGVDSGLNKYRLTLGTAYKINKKRAIGFFYRIERELNVSQPKATYIIGLKYTHTIKREIKKDEEIYY